MSAALLLAAAIAASFTSGPAMLLPRSDHSATLLPDGRVLIAGGHPTDPHCEIYDPATHTFRETASLSRPRPYGPTATLLNDGRVLIVGGGVDPDFRGLPFGSYGDSGAEIFDPRTETFTPAGSMSATRYAHAATLLADGRVLVSGGGTGRVGGFSYALFPQRSVEIYDPNTNAFTVAPSMESTRWYHTATTLNDGTVLFAGTASDWEVTPAAEIYDAAGPREVLGFRPDFLRHTSTLLNDGRVLIASRNVVEIYDPATRIFHSAGSTMMWGGHTATSLRDGRVLMAGASGVEIFDPRAGESVAIGSMHTPRQFHRATLLRNGTVLITGGTLGGVGRIAATEIIALPTTRRRIVRNN